MRIQYEIDDETWARMQRYVSGPKIRHEVARDALVEWITRHEGRDKKFQYERLVSDARAMAPVVKFIMENGLITVDLPGSPLRP